MIDIIIHAEESLRQPVKFLSNAEPHGSMRMVFFTEAAGRGCLV